MRTLALSQTDLDFIGDALMELGNDDSVLDVCELEGFVTALACSPDAVPEPAWQAEIWGGAPYWPEPGAALCFNELVQRQLDDVRLTLEQSPADFEPLLFEQEINGEIFVIAQEWCFGFMRGVALAAWPPLSEQARPALEAIALHGTEAGCEQLERFSVAEHQASVRSLGPAAATLYQYWHQRPADPCR
jgi:uncharacterized protein